MDGWADLNSAVAHESMGVTQLLSDSAVSVEITRCTGAVRQTYRYRESAIPGEAAFPESGLAGNTRLAQPLAQRILGTRAWLSIQKIAGTRIVAATCIRPTRPLMSQSRGLASEKALKCFNWGKVRVESYHRDPADKRVLCVWFHPSPRRSFLHLRSVLPTARTGRCQRHRLSIRDILVSQHASCPGMLSDGAADGRRELSHCERLIGPWQ